MRLAIIGPGAVGATFAAALERAGHEVVLCGRRPAPAPILERGDGDEQRLAAQVLHDPAAADGPYEWVLLTVKSHQTPGAAAWLRALCGEGTTVAVLQNGVEHREVVTPYANGSVVLPVIVWCSSEAVAPGRIRLRGDAALSVADDALGARFAALFDGGAEVRRVPDFATEAWRKLTANCVVGLEAVTERRAEVFRDDRIRALAEALGRECVTVARAEGASLSDEDADRIVAGLAAAPGDVGTSILFDRIARVPLEWDARNGVVQRLGARHGIPTPVSDVLVPLMAALDPSP